MTKHFILYLCYEHGSHTRSPTNWTLQLRYRAMLDRNLCHNNKKDSNYFDRIVFNPGVQFKRLRLSISIAHCVDANIYGLFKWILVKLSVTLLSSVSLDVCICHWWLVLYCALSNDDESNMIFSHMFMWIFSFQHMSQLVRKLGPECRIRHDTVPLEQQGLSALKPQGPDSVRAVI